MSFPAWIFVAFLVLKLCHVIDWSWWWVTAPLWATVLGAVLWSSLDWCERKGRGWR